MNKKIILSSLVLMLLSLSSCNKNDNSSSSVTNDDYSILTGTYTFDKAIKKDKNDQDLRLYNKVEEAKDGNMFTSDYYPLNTVNNTKVCYAYQQSLQFKRDYTYHYEYSITLTNSEEWGKDFATIKVIMEGTFVPTLLEEDFETGVRKFEATLNNPTSGSETIYGMTIVGEGSLFAWNLNSAATYELDIALALNENEDFIYNRLIKGRKVEVLRGEERVLTDDIYYYDILKDIAPYSDYKI